MVFNIAISNTDDHLRNHGFILQKKGWQLSPAYDINPSIDKDGLASNIDTDTNALDEIPVSCLQIIDNTKSYQLFITESSVGEFKLYGKTKDYHVIILTIMDKKITKEYTTIDEMEPPF